ncbi:MAG: MarR family transcriptional regulator [Tessaracoccus sp.]
MRLFDVDASDPDSKLVDRSSLSHADIAQIDTIMATFSRLRHVEDLLVKASNDYMNLNRTDMRALHFLIVKEHKRELVTPSAIATHLGISTASTTQLLDRLERGHHITREPHPRDRRALVIRVTPETHESAMNTVGRQQSRRFTAAARLTPEEREVVIRFLTDMTDELSLHHASWATEPKH